MMNKINLVIALLLFSGLLYAQKTEAPLFRPFEIAAPMIQQQEYSIVKYGAAENSEDNTANIQKAIDDCALNGGGKVLIPKGVYLTGPITLKSKVNLFIDQGAVLKALPFGLGNGLTKGTYPNAGKVDLYTHLISAKACNDIKISGSGKIDGQGETWWSAYRANKKIKRGCLIRLDECQRIEISGITLINAPNVHITVGRKSSDALISKVTINCPEEAPNTDGIDVWAPNVKIVDCNINCGDDNIAMDAGTRNMLIHNCKFGTGHGCSIGSYTSGIKNVLVENCSFEHTTSGIRLKSNRDRGGGEDSITYRNITMKSVKYPIYITSYYPKAPVLPTDDNAMPVINTTPTWRNITIENVEVKAAKNSIFVWGLPELAISNLYFKNVRIDSDKGMVLNYVNCMSFSDNCIFHVKSGTIVESKYSANVTGL